MLTTVTLSSPLLVFGQQQVPFNGLQLTYHSETTQTLQEKMGIHATSWTTLLFRNVTSASSILDINTNGTITTNDQPQTEKFNTTVSFPTDRDTLVYLRNGGRDNLTIYAGPSGLTLASLPGLTVDLTRSWNLYDKPLIRTRLGAFSGYRYHTQMKSLPLSSGGTVDLDFYASYDANTQVLMAGEVWATLNGSSAMIEQTEVWAANTLTSQSQGGPRCLIATATFGSELAPQVQFLRDFRDQKLDNTFAGYNFMIAFNLWYYSFSPSVAATISESPLFQILMRVFLYPLITLLKVSETVFDVFSFQPEFAAVLAGLVASAMLGVVYLWIPSIIICRRYRTTVKRSLKPMAAILGGAVVAITVSEILANSFLAISSSVALVLANMSLFAALPGIFPDLHSMVRLAATKRRP
jgi:hypothetical protein